MNTPTAEALLDLIEFSIANYERSLQKEVGPSELGTPCLRRLGFRLAEVPEAHDDSGWRPAVGSAVHVELGRMLELSNVLRNSKRWLVEKRVECGTLDGSLVTGTVDVYDTENDELVDWKIVGPTALTRYRRMVKVGKVPDEKYRAQVQVYARGLVRRLGYPVKEVGIMFLPMNGELNDAVYWHEPYRPEIGVEVFARAREIKAALAEQGPSLLAQLIRADDFCGHCPWFVPGTEDLERECPGAPEMMAERGKNPFEDLI